MITSPIGQISNANSNTYIYFADCKPFPSIVVASEAIVFNTFKISSL